MNTDFIGNYDIKTILDAYIKNDKLPHILLYGDVGCGKTWVAGTYIINEYFRSKNMLTEISNDKYIRRNFVYELHASIQRGRETTSSQSEGEDNNIIHFIRKSIVKKDDTIHKIIIIYDFNNITSDAQMSLRRTIEKFSKEVRFILVCQSLDDIIDSIQSRFVLLKMNKISDSDLRKLKNDKNENKNENENGDYDDLNEQIIKLSNGDLRQYKIMNNICDIGNIHSLSHFNEIFGKIEDSDIITLLSTSRKININTKLNILLKLEKQGYTFKDVFESITIYILNMNVSEKKINHLFLEKLLNAYRKNEITEGLIHFIDIFPFS